MSDYWIYAPNGQTPLLKTLKAYSPDKICSKYVLMSAGTNTKSIQLKTKDFFRLITEKNILIQNLID